MLKITKRKKTKPLPKISEKTNCSERDTPPPVIWRIQFVAKMRVVKN